ncbi:hypothetical protein M0802_016022 [Mischocyttarus mexicanus]|nr:hypothetical protein M0802_016022 [Mischocyttarus mexicanus]
MYKIRLERKIEDNNINEIDTVEEGWKKLAKNILTASEEELETLGSELIITKGQVIRSIQTLKNRKVPGVDTIGNEQIRYGRPSLEKLPGKIAVNTGIRQGHSLGPLLFNLVMDKIIESVKPIATSQQTNEFK